MGEGVVARLIAGYLVVDIDESQGLTACDDVEYH